MSPVSVMRPSGKMATSSPASSAAAASLEGPVLEGGVFAAGRDGDGPAVAKDETEHRPVEDAVVHDEADRARQAAAMISASTKLTWLQTSTAGPSAACARGRCFSSRYTEWTSSQTMKRSRNSGTRP